MQSNQLGIPEVNMFNILLYFLETLGPAGYFVNKSAFTYRDRQLYLAKCEDPLPIVWSRTLPFLGSWNPVKSPDPRGSTP